MLSQGTRTWERRRPQHQQHHQQKRRQKRQQQQQGQQTQHRSQLLSELQPEPPLLPLLKSVDRRPPSRATTISAATGAWYDSFLRLSRRACTAFPVALAKLKESNSKVLIFNYRTVCLLDPVMRHVLPSYHVSGTRSDAVV